jgi:hypothetical protein
LCKIPKERGEVRTGSRDRRAHNLAMLGTDPEMRRQLPHSKSYKKSEFQDNEGYSRLRKARQVYASCPRRSLVEPTSSLESKRLREERFVSSVSKRFDKKYDSRYFLEELRCFMLGFRGESDKSRVL